MLFIIDEDVITQCNVKRKTLIYVSFDWMIPPQLSGRARMTDEVQLIPLKTARLPTSSKCLTAGWGDVGDNNTQPVRLQEVNVTTLSQRTCRSRWRAVPITRTMVCGVGESNFQGFCSVRPPG